MFNASMCAAQLPASDFERAKKFYQDTVGAKLLEDMGEGGARFDGGGGTTFFVYPSQFAGTNKATALGFEVDDVDKAVDDLISRGITFEQYDLPNVKTNKHGVAEFGGWKGAWFKDTEGNIIAIAQAGS